VSKQEYRVRCNCKWDWCSSGKKASIVTRDAEQEMLKSETMRSYSYYRHR